MDVITGNAFTAKQSKISRSQMVSSLCVLANHKWGSIWNILVDWFHNHFAVNWYYDVYPVTKNDKTRAATIKWQLCPNIIFNLPYLGKLYTFDVSKLSIVSKIYLPQVCVKSYWQMLFYCYRTWHSLGHDF